MTTDASEKWRHRPGAPRCAKLGEDSGDFQPARNAAASSLTKALARGVALRRGVYLACPGPSLETAAEYRFMRMLGADAVGMSTVPEVIVAVHAGLKVLGFSAITDECLPDALEPVDIERIIATANRIEPTLTDIVAACIARMHA